MLDERLKGRLVVVSPHLDDAVLSLGATIAHAVQSGSNVEILTVFACAPDSNAPTDDWDRKSGFTTEGEAAQQRRREDEAPVPVDGRRKRVREEASERTERHRLAAVDGGVRRDAAFRAL